MKRYFFIILIIYTVLVSCKRDSNKLEYLGPKYIGSFTITKNLTISADPTDFGSPVYFTAEFNKMVDWKVTITGNSSGATKVINGNSLSLSSVNAIWDGSSDSVYFFRAETCQAVLSFLDTSLTQSIVFTISVPKTHAGYLINDFESSSFGTYLGSNNGNYFDAPDMATSTIDLFGYSPAPQGNKVLRFDCHDVNSSYYVGGVYHNSVATNYGIPLIENDSLYLNLFVYGYPSGNAALSIEIIESDGDKWQPAQISVNWIGWKLISLKFSQTSNNSGTGNITRETNKINGVNISMNSIPPGNHCMTLVDYLHFTERSPLKP